MLKETLLPQTFWSTVKHNWRELMEQSPLFKVLPQMPTHQLIHFATIAAKKRHAVIIQTNPFAKQENIQELHGKIKLLPESGQIILTENGHKTYHLLHPEAVRHIRLDLS